MWRLVHSYFDSGTHIAYIEYYLETHDSTIFYMHGRRSIVKRSGFIILVGHSWPLAKRPWH